MERNTIMQDISKNLSDSQMALFCEIVSLMDIKDLESIYIDYSMQKFKTFAELINSIKKQIDFITERESKKYALKNFKGTRYQEQLILQRYCLKKWLDKSPEWLRNSYIYDGNSKDAASF